MSTKKEALLVEVSLTKGYFCKNFSLSANSKQSHVNVGTVTQETYEKNIFKIFVGIFFKEDR